MRKVIIRFNDTKEFINVEAEEFHEDGNFIKAYNHSELVAIVDIACVRSAHISEQKEWHPYASIFRDDRENGRNSSN